jgi:hypothetical protein
MRIRRRCTSLQVHRTRRIATIGLALMATVIVGVATASAKEGPKLYLKSAGSILMPGASVGVQMELGGTMCTAGYNGTVAVNERATDRITLEPDGGYCANPGSYQLFGSGPASIKLTWTGEVSFQPRKSGWTIEQQLPACSYSLYRGGVSFVVPGPVEPEGSATLWLQRSISNVECPQDKPSAITVLINSGRYDLETELRGG